VRIGVIKRFRWQYEATRRAPKCWFTCHSEKTIERGFTILGKPDQKYVRDHQAWEIPKAWFNTFVEAALLRYRQVYVVQPYREYEVCAPACRNAKGHDCNCSCMGQNHGTGDGSGWFDVSDTFSVKWGEKEMALRLMKIS